MIQEDLSSSDCRIGGCDENGNSIIVEIDESKFVPDRSARTLLSIKEEFVLPGSTVHTDYWAGYNSIENMGRELAHQTVNHSVEYVTVDGVHTNSIEGTWNGIKLNVVPRLRSRKMMPWVLVEVIWRCKHCGDITG
ncbi:hypothetical protein A0J61_11447 [Choanephora cucurbitarum]|uniref:ISXO2-like transposase domain-containing protein n=1 Tax=Choanephora cucurbitarum TaxID=101091 RepID=A0A1C7MUI1_9FUNG|nr:hypothetical protein A0J61_11447 [Choanephora cucurbitarum]